MLNKDNKREEQIKNLQQNDSNQSIVQEGAFNLNINEYENINEQDSNEVPGVQEIPPMQYSSQYHQLNRNVLIRENIAIQALPQAQNLNRNRINPARQIIGQDQLVQINRYEGGLSLEPESNNSNESLGIQAPAQIQDRINPARQRIEQDRLAQINRYEGGLSLEPESNKTNSNENLRIQAPTQINNWDLNSSDIKRHINNENRFDSEEEEEKKINRSNLSIPTSYNYQVTQYQQNKYNPKSRFQQSKYDPQKRDEKFQYKLNEERFSGQEEGGSIRSRHDNQAESINAASFNSVELQARSPKIDPFDKIQKRILKLSQSFMKLSNKHFMDTLFDQV